MKEPVEKTFIQISVFIFFLFFVFGLLSAMAYPDGANLIINRVDVFFGFAKNLNPFFLVLFIFLNNAIKAFLAMLFGIIFGLVPIFFLIANGFILGVFSLVEFDKGWTRLVAGILPHGIFELAGVFLATGYGMWMGYHFFKFIFFRERFSPVFKKAMKKYFRVILPILFLASLVEVFITPIFIKLTK